MGCKLSSNSPSPVTTSDPPWIGVLCICGAASVHLQSALPPSSLCRPREQPHESSQAPDPCPPHFQITLQLSSHKAAAAASQALSAPSTNIRATAALRRWLIPALASSSLALWQRPSESERGPNRWRCAVCPVLKPCELLFHTVNYSSTL